MRTERRFRTASGDLRATRSKLGAGRYGPPQKGKGFLPLNAALGIHMSEKCRLCVEPPAKGWERDPLTTIVGRFLKPISAGSRPLV